MCPQVSDGTRGAVAPLVPLPTSTLHHAPLEQHLLWVHAENQQKNMGHCE